MVTYHDPCHAKNTRCLERTKELLKTKLCFLKEMSDSNRCCGFGGVTIQTRKFSLQEQLETPKAAMIRDTKAQIINC